MEACLEYVVTVLLMCVSCQTLDAFEYSKSVSSTITTTRPVTVATLEDEIHALKTIVHKLQKTTTAQQETFETEKRQSEKQRQMLLAQINAQQHTIAQQQKDIDILKQKNGAKIIDKSPTVASSGVVDCGDSYSWKSGDFRPPNWPNAVTYQVTKSVRVNFTTNNNSCLNNTPPRVQLSVVGLHNENRNTEYGAVVESVDNEGFVMRCMTYDNTYFPLLDMIVSWMTV